MANKFPAEFEPHAATWIAWPHAREDWPGKFAAIPLVFVEIVRQLVPGERVRILVNDEFGALDNLLRVLPACLNGGGRVAILTFHSGEDRRVKRSFQEGLRNGIYSHTSDEALRPTAAESYANPRASSAKLRWAIRGSVCEKGQ